MSTIPPPPPLLLSSSSNNNIKLQSPQKDSQLLFLSQSDLCIWANEHPELKESCIRNSVCMFKEPFRYKYRYFQSIQQMGPTCGLVALSMLLNGRIPLDIILNEAKELGYTCNGEMFSCKQLAQLAKLVFKMADIYNLNIQIEKGGLYTQGIVDRLLNGAILLVPYDADFNNSPSLKNGHTAHWALVCGIIITKDRDFGIDPLNIHVLAKHGKSKYLASWQLEQLAISNGNLMEFSPKKSEDGLIYVLPEGGIGGENGLKDQFIIIEGF